MSILKKVKVCLYCVYKYFQDSTIIATLSFFVYTRILPLLVNEASIHSKRTMPQNNQGACEEKTRLEGVKIALISDEMTYQDIKDECQIIYLTPKNWRFLMEQEKPDLLFCESTWSGISVYPDCWRCRIYRNHHVRFEHRKELLELLSYCKEKKIPTAFWNKEDPTFFGNDSYDFVDTALKFDFIFTTAQECVPFYQDRGHTNVSVLMFGFSPKLFYPLSLQREENTAVFAGSWYADQPERCQDMEAIFDKVLRQGIRLKIYDRHYGSSNPIHQFPKKYSSFIYPRVEYNNLVKIYNKADYGISINTVKNSKTMFARRVFELMACGTIVISNDSLGLRRLFNGRIWFIDDCFDHRRKDEISVKNRIDVIKNHTCRRRLEEMTKKMGFPKP